MESWTLATTLPNAEAILSDSFQRLNLEYHLFKTRRNTVHRGRVIQQIVPIFPRYVFVKACGYWQAIREAKGFSDFVRWANGEPAHVPAHIVQELVAKAEQPGDILSTESKPAAARFKFGAAVRLMGDTMAAGCEGIYQHAIGNDRCIVLMDWLGRLVPIDLDERDLQCLDMHTHGKHKKRKHYRPKRRPVDFVARVTQ